MSEQHFDDWLKAALQQEPEPLDAGFSAHVVAQLEAGSQWPAPWGRRWWS